MCMCVLSGSKHKHRVQWEKYHVFTLFFFPKMLLGMRAGLANGGTFKVTC